MKSSTKLSAVGLAVAMTLFAAAPASAATITCVPTNVNVIASGLNVSPGQATCTTITATAGFDIIGIAIALVGSYEDSVPGNLHQVQFTATNNYNAATIVASSPINDFVGTTGFVQSATWATAPTTLIPSIVITVNAASLGSLPNPANASFSAYVVTQERARTVPDSGSTLALLGSAFLGLGALRRRFNV